MQKSEEIRKMLGVSRAEFSRRYHIPIRTLEEWDGGNRNPPEYVMEALERVVKEDIAYSKWVGNHYKLDGEEFVIKDYKDMNFILESNDKIVKYTPDELAELFLKGELVIL